MKYAYLADAELLENSQGIGSLLKNSKGLNQSNSHLKIVKCLKTI